MEDVSADRSYKSNRKLTICMVSDFFFPNTGGVEIHILNLAYCLIEKGHKVIGITHKYGNRTGVRYMQNGFKIYYCNFPSLPSNAGNIIFPILHSPHMVPLLRDIFIREEVDLVHWHQASSMLGLYIAMNSELMGVRVVRTNHSLSELEDPFQIMLSKLNSMLIHSNYLDHVISVSHAVRENEICRSNIPVWKTSAIPNAIDSNMFIADPSLRNPVGTINIIYVARLTARKGTDLLFELIVRISRKYLNVHWIIGGDGNKMPELRFLIKKFKLEDRVELLGFVPNNNVCSVLNRGHIFLNTSISEAFCISALEAASSGLLVVTTNVGGTPEILPHEYLMLSNPNVDSLYANMEKAISVVNDISPSVIHEKVRQYYSWRNVSDRVEKIYYHVLDTPKVSSRIDFERYIVKKGGMSLVVFFVQYLFSWIILLILNVLRPARSIERAINFPYRKYAQNKEKWGDHQFDLRKNELNRN